MTRHIASEACKTRRERVLAHLPEHPGLTQHEIAQALSGKRGGAYGRLLVDMQRKGQVIPAKEERNGRLVTVWYIAPPGTKPVNIPDPDRVLKRERDRMAARRRRARARGENPELSTARVTARRLALPAAALDLGNWRSRAACLGTSPELFFSDVPADIQQAQQVCAGCPVIAECAARADANDEQFGIWAGVDRNVRHLEQVAS